MNEVICIKDLQVDYEEDTALKHVNIEIEEKEFIGIIGPNGGGKTTLLKTLLGMKKQTKGSIEIKEDQVIGYVPQFTTFDKNFPIKVLDVILLGHLPKKVKLFQKFTNSEREHAKEIMKKLKIDHLKDRNIHALSGGQMQRVLIARAMMTHPTILILDEPTSGVDEQSTNEIYRLLKELNKHMTILMITHDSIDLMEYFDRVIYINKTAHTHVAGEKPAGKPDEACPIDWFVEGKRIQENLEKEKEK